MRNLVTAIDQLKEDQEKLKNKNDHLRKQLESIRRKTNYR